MLPYMVFRMLIIQDKKAGALSSVQKEIKQKQNTLAYLYQELALTFID
jgi:hypothetical protein